MATTIEGWMKSEAERMNKQNEQWQSRQVEHGERPDIDRIKAQYEASTKGNWRACHDGDCICGLVWSTEVDAIVHKPETESEDSDIVLNQQHVKANARFIADAHQDIPALIAYIEALEHIVADCVRLTDVMGGIREVPYEQAESIYRDISKRLDND